MGARAPRPGSGGGSIDPADVPILYASAAASTNSRIGVDELNLWMPAIFRSSLAFSRNSSRTSAARSSADFLLIPDR